MLLRGDIKKKFSTVRIGGELNFGLGGGGNICLYAALFFMLHNFFNNFSYCHPGLFTAPATRSRDAQAWANGKCRPSNSISNNSTFDWTSGTQHGLLRG